MKASDTGAPSETPKERPRQSAWARVLHKVKCDFRERGAPKGRETSADRAARVTANATRWIAWLTLAIAIVAALQLYELFLGSADTKATASAAKQQAYAAQRFAAASERDARAAEGFAASAEHISAGIRDAVVKLNSQAAATRDLAVQARIQSRITAKQLDLSERPWMKVDVSLVDDNGKTSPASLDDANNLRIHFSIDAENVGKSPALRVKVESQLIPLSQHKDAEQAQNAICDELRRPAAFPLMIGVNTVSR